MEAPHFKDITSLRGLRVCLQADVYLLPWTLVAIHKGMNLSGDFPFLSTIDRYGGKGNRSVYCVTLCDRESSVWMQYVHVLQLMHNVSARVGRDATTGAQGHVCACMF